jgi:protein-S-isoprenylcysteine O-methyltransferase Ste14
VIVRRSPRAIFKRWSRPSNEQLLESPLAVVIVVVLFFFLAVLLIDVVRPAMTALVGIAPCGRRYSGRRGGATEVMS